MDIPGGLYSNMENDVHWSSRKIIIHWYTAKNWNHCSLIVMFYHGLKNVLGSIIWSMRNISCIYYNFIIYYIVISDFWPRYYWNIVESGVKHHNWNPLIFGTLLYWFYVFLWFFLLVFELFRQCGIFILFFNY
jgi:hypothetical protein